MDDAAIKSAFDAMCELAQTETLRHFRQSVAIDNKHDDGFDPVTLADKNAERAIRNWLETHYPDHEIWGEEFGQKQTGSDYLWIIDPIDGTRAFIAGLPSWGTMIGLYHKGQPIAGVMHQPFTGEKYWSAGETSWLEFKGAHQRLETSKTNSLDQATIMTTMPELFKGKEAALWNEISAACRLTRYGFDCYAYAMLAAGHIDLVVESGLQAYDIAALIPLIENAGGVFSNWQGSSATKGGQIIASANENLHKEAIRILSRASRF